VATAFRAGFLAAADRSNFSAEFAGHLHLLVREAVPLARLNPGPDLRRKRLL
jgi:hypothetical protein